MRYVLLIGLKKSSALAILNELVIDQFDERVTLDVLIKPKQARVLDKQALMTNWLKSEDDNEHAGD